MTTLGPNIHTCDCTADDRSGTRKVFLGYLTWCQRETQRSGDEGQGKIRTSSLMANTMLASLESSGAYIAYVLSFSIVSTCLQCIWFGELDCRDADQRHDHGKSGSVK